MRYIVLIVLAAAIAYYLWFNFTVPKTVGLINGNLQSCPKSPNCVSCLNEDKGHYIQPLPYRSEKSLDLIEGYLTTHYDAQMIRKTPDYMHVVVTSKVCKFKDDLEFLAVPQKKEICVRSASRIGYGDMDVNRKRIEKIRAFLSEVTR